MKSMKRLILLSIMIVMAAGTFLSVSAMSVKAETPEKSTVVSIYDSIKVAQGETLEDIAVRYNNSGIYTNTEYIEEVKRVNGIYTDTIHAGCYLTVITFSK